VSKLVTDDDTGRLSLLDSHTPCLRSRATHSTRTLCVLIRGKEDGVPRDLFGDVTAPSITLGTRKWYSVPLSFVAHTAVIGAIVVVPLVATGALPMPATRPMIVELMTPPVPQPPPAPRRATPAPPSPANRNAAPSVAPDTIAPDRNFDAGFENITHREIGIVGGSEVDGGVVVPPPAAAPPPAREERVRIGGVVRAPERLSHVAPIYPPVALAARVRGLVIIEAVIDTRGNVQDARILRSDSPLLNEAAVTAVRQWTYSPTLLNGVPVSVVMTVTVQFALR
jgi:protein TonB